MFRNDEPSRFVQVPVELLESDNLSPSALKLYCILLSYCWGKKTKAWPGHAKLAEQMHCTDRWIRQLLKELVEAGLVRVEERPGTTCIYHIHKFQLLGSTEAKQAVPLSTELSTESVDSPAGGNDTSDPPRNDTSEEIHEPKTDSINKKRFNPKASFDRFKKGDTKPGARKSSIDWSKFAPGGKYHYLCQVAT